MTPLGVAPDLGLYMKDGKNFRQEVSGKFIPSCGENRIVAVKTTRHRYQWSSATSTNVASSTNAGSIMRSGRS
jgi:hypothetical protein